MENCLFNRTIVNDLWKDFLSMMINEMISSLTFFFSYLLRGILALIDKLMLNSNVEKDLFAFGLSLSDSLMTFLKSDAIENSQVDQI